MKTSQSSAHPKPLESETVDQALARQKHFFEQGATLEYKARVSALKSLKSMVQTYEAKILEALHSDLRKPAFEAYSSEVGTFYQEVDYILGHLKDWMKPKSVRSPITLQPSRSQLRSRPYGNALLFGPFNYPFQLIMNPLAGLLAAGNTVLVKPSELAPQTSGILAEMLDHHIDPAWVQALQGGPELSESLSMRPDVDIIVFTGSTFVGKKVAANAAKNLIPTVLELGGKSPCILSPSASLEIATRRIVWGKFFNAGQTCVAPDYLLVPEEKKDEVLEWIEKHIRTLYGADPQKSPDFGRIISLNHLNRLKSLIENRSIALGGKVEAEDLYMAPTVLTEVRWDEPIMKEEIFGPILPILTYKNLEEVRTRLQKLPTPLALYFFSATQSEFDEFSRWVKFGGGAWNDTLVHLASPKLPLGGMGASGWGRYKGPFSFEAFSHTQGIVLSPPRWDIPLRYPPYKEKILALMKRFLN